MFYCYIFPHFCVILLVLWLLGLLSGYTIIHVLLVITIVVVLVRVKGIRTTRSLRALEAQTEPFRLGMLEVFKVIHVEYRSPIDLTVLSQCILI